MQGLRVHGLPQRHHAEALDDLLHALPLRAPCVGIATRVASCAGPVYFTKLFCGSVQIGSFSATTACHLYSVQTCLSLTAEMCGRGGLDVVLSWQAVPCGSGRDSVSQQRNPLERNHEGRPAS